MLAAHRRGGVRAALRRRRSCVPISSFRTRAVPPSGRGGRGYRAGMIEAHGLTKDYGDKRAVDGLSFTVQPGIVTGFLGPNGSGKSTTMRLILGLDAPTAGEVTVNGKPYREHAAPLHEVGALLEARSVHTGRTAYKHLLALAQTHGSRAAASTRWSSWSGSRRSRGSGRHVLARDGAAARDRLRAARRPAHRDARRAGQRARPRGDPVGAQPTAPARLRRPRGLRLLAPDERDGAHGRPPDRDRPRQEDRRHDRRGARSARPPAWSSVCARRRPTSFAIT